MNAARKVVADMTTPTDRSAHRPGAISAFFIYKAGFFAAGFWVWLGYLAARGGAATGWHVVAATGATTTTLVGVLLGIRFYQQRNAAVRHQEIMRTLVEISWDSFTPPQGFGDARASGEAPRAGDTRDGDAGVIRLSPELRQRPRR
jgi:hypothetical protein